VGGLKYYHCALQDELDDLDDYAEGGGVPHKVTSHGPWLRGVWREVQEVGASEAAYAKPFARGIQM
jgi:hypothetical protein